MSLRSKWFEYCAARSAYMEPVDFADLEQREREDHYRIQRNKRKRMRDLRIAWKRAVRREGLKYQAVIKDDGMHPPGRTANNGLTTNYLEYGYQLSDGQKFNIEEPL